MFPRTPVLPLVSTSAVLAEPDEFPHDAILCRVHRFPPGNRKDFLTRSRLFQNRASWAANQVTKANGIEFLHAPDRDGFALPNEHPSGSLTDVSDGCKVSEGNFDHAGHARFLSSAHFLPTFPNRCPVKPGDGLAGKLAKLGKLPVLCERNGFREIATKKINRVAQENLRRVVVCGVFPCTGAAEGAVNRYGEFFAPEPNMPQVRFLVRKVWR
jgi:hypothetical protein